jgi:hypothetical protein
MRIDPPMTLPPAAPAATPATRPVAASLAIPPLPQWRSGQAEAARPVPTPGLTPAAILPPQAAPLSAAPPALISPPPPVTVSALTSATGLTPAPQRPTIAVPQPLPFPLPLPDRLTLTPVATAHANVDFKTRALQAILQSLGGGRPLPAQFQLLLRDEAGAYQPPAAGVPTNAAAPSSAATAVAPAALLQSTLQLQTSLGQTLPARLTLALMPALVAARPELAEALRQRLLDDQPLPMKLDAAPAELAGQRLLFEFTDPRAQWSMQALAMRGLLVVGQPEKLRGKPVWRLPADEEEDGQDATAEAENPPYVLADDGGPPRISTLRWAGLLLVPLYAKLRALLR